MQRRVSGRQSGLWLATHRRDRPELHRQIPRLPCRQPVTDLVMTSAACINGIALRFANASKEVELHNPIIRISTDGDAIEFIVRHSNCEQFVASRQLTPSANPSRGDSAAVKRRCQS